MQDHSREQILYPPHNDDDYNYLEQSGIYENNVNVEEDTIRSETLPSDHDSLNPLHLDPRSYVASWDTRDGFMPCLVVKKQQKAILKVSHTLKTAHRPEEKNKEAQTFGANLSPSTVRNACLLIHPNTFHMEKKPEYEKTRI